MNMLKLSSIETRMQRIEEKLRIENPGAVSTAFMELVGRLDV